MNNKVVFMMGPGHCGSTLLDLILGSHSDCFSLGEVFRLSEISDISSSQNLKICGICADRCPFWSRQTSLEDFKHHFCDQDLPDLPENSQKPPRRNLYQNLFTRTEVSILVDSSKDPGWIQHQINLLKTRMKITPLLIYMCRDGRAVVNSHLRKYPERGIAALTHQWKKRVLRMNEYFQTFPSERRIRVHYENLAEDPDRVIRSLCRFLELPFESDMINYWQHDHHPIAGNLGTRSLILDYRSRSGQVFSDFQEKSLRGEKYWDYYRKTGLGIRLDMRWKE